MSSSDLPAGWSEISEEESRRLRDCHPASLVNDLVRHTQTELLMPRMFLEQQWDQRQTWDI